MFTWKPQMMDGPLYDVEDLADTGIDKEFDSRAEAEEWVTQNYELLEELGVDAVSLYEGEELLYKMALAAE